MSNTKVTSVAKPFLKWAGGKTQLINSIEEALPKNLFVEEFTYIEPFVGSGAVLFWILNNFPNLKKAVINDVNSDLINTYRTIAKSPKELISVLKEIQSEYHSLQNDLETQNDCYILLREFYNTREADKVTQAALFIFLNKAGFNGIYRVNGKNLYNVPKGSSATPPICDEINILAVSAALQKVEILEGDYHQTLNYATEKSFFYFDPPYKPLSQTSSFNSYTKAEFNDDEQIRLKRFCNHLDKEGHSWMLSNSDVRGNDPSNDFFDELYNEFIIKRVLARRSVNSNPEKRGLLSELLITNYFSNSEIYGKQRVLVENI